tara:strand:- start:30637 stop:30834 length:198 start_codon:yes stop_codon:yes gene_type:complete
MAHDISNKAKLTVTEVVGNLGTIDAAIQTALRGSTFANGDTIIDIKMVRNRTSNLVTAYIIWEDQ